MSYTVSQLKHHLVSMSGISINQFQSPFRPYLDMVPSSYADDTRELRGCFRGGFVYVSFFLVCFKVKENPERFPEPRSFAARYV